MQEGLQYSALQDFRRARRKAALEQIMAFLTGESADLLSYEEVRKKLKVTGSSGHKLKEIPLDAIIGSVGRYTDFTRNFLPKSDSDQSRWAKVQAAVTSPGASPRLRCIRSEMPILCWMGIIGCQLPGNLGQPISKPM